ncbi:hypothetical protein Dsin_012908 [Dipteronia sinensis]|uniref:RNase H type-1 domain-containing protein n=1 Tax=Dipteronia sinensis TaxID=43782 RepID=A0AAE0AIZ1_9ROSI|nr:hypothetical protein Dsin_012908 [Dipteronia sinensis]
MEPMQTHQVPTTEPDSEQMTLNSNGQTSCMGRRLFGAAENVPSMVEHSSPTSIENCIIEANKMEAIYTEQCDGLHDESIIAGKIKSINLGQVGDNGLAHVDHIDQSPLCPSILMNDISVGPCNSKKCVYNTKQGGFVTEKKSGANESGGLGQQQKNKMKLVREVKAYTIGEIGKDWKLGLERKREAIMIDDVEALRRNSKVGRWITVVDEVQSSGEIKKQGNVDPQTLDGKNSFLESLEVTQGNESVLGDQNGQNVSNMGITETVTSLLVSSEVQMDIFDVVDWATNFLVEYKNSSSGESVVQRKIRCGPAKWSPLCLGVYKINCDAAINSKNSRIGVGIVIRDSHGFVMASNSQINKYTHIDFACGVILSDISNLSAARNGLSICFIPRQANQVAHFLAKNTLKSNHDLFWMDEVPMFADKLVQDDMHVICVL